MTIVNMLHSEIIHLNITTYKGVVISTLSAVLINESYNWPLNADTYIHIHTKTCTHYHTYLQIYIYKDTDTHH